MSHRRPMPESERAQRRAGIVRVVRDGLSASAAAARYGVTVRTVYLACQAQGLRFGPTGESGAYAARRRLRAAIARAGSRGLTSAQLADRFGVSQDTASQACRAAGVALRRAASPKHARALAMRVALRPRAKELVALYGPPRGRKTARAAGRRRGRPFGSPRSWEAARLLLTTALTMGAIGDRCGLSYKRVQEIWGDIRQAAAGVGRRVQLANVPGETLTREQKRRQTIVSRLKRKRDGWLDKVAQLERQIRKHGGSLNGTAVRRGPGVPPGTPQGGRSITLAGALAKLPKGRTMSVTDMSEAVRKAGYKSASPNFRGMVNGAMLKHTDLFRRVGRGLYTAR